MAVRYHSPINFEETCNLSGADVLSVGVFDHGGSIAVIATKALVRIAEEFIEFKFGSSPKEDSVFVWDLEDCEREGAVRIHDEDIEDDSSRFFKLLKMYEKRHSD